MKTALLFACTVLAIIPAAVAISSSSTEIGRIHFWYHEYFVAFGSWGQATSLSFSNSAYTDELQIHNEFQPESIRDQSIDADYFGGGNANAVGFGFSSDPHNYGWLHIFIAVPHLMISIFWLLISCVVLLKSRIKISIGQLLGVTTLFAIATTAFKSTNPMPFVALTWIVSIVVLVVFLGVSAYRIPAALIHLKRTCGQKTQPTPSAK